MTRKSSPIHWLARVGVKGITAYTALAARPASGGSPAGATGSWRISFARPNSARLSNHSRANASTSVSRATRKQPLNAECTPDHFSLFSPHRTLFRPPCERQSFNFCPDENSKSERRSIGDTMVKKRNKRGREASTDSYAHECKIRDAYSRDLAKLRPKERLLKTATRFEHTSLIADMSTTDETGTVRVWEFKIIASYDSLGQVLVYLAQKRLDYLVQNASDITQGKLKDIRGVLAAFEFRPEVEIAVAILNLGVELVRIPRKYMAAGDVPNGITRTDIPTILS